MDELRVGVTGHRALAAPAVVAGEVDRILDGLRSLSRVVIAVSSLAEGADRIVARRVLAGTAGRLEVVLPLAVDDYATDFADPASRIEYDALLAAASGVVVVPADPTHPSREAAYERAGRAVLDRCDVLLALWDGRPSRGRGGTAEIIAHARACGLRVEVVAVERAV
ncbi:MAG: hypothetical protein WKF79_01975 [Nocardioides sp.]